MPTLDDITTLQTNAKVAINDPVAVVDKSSSGSSRVEQFPLGLIAQGFTHAWVINHDNSNFTSGSGTTASFNIHTFTSTERLTKIRAVVTELWLPAAGETATGFHIDIGESGDSGTDNLIDAIDMRTTLYNQEDNTGAGLAGDIANPAIDDPANESITVLLTVSGTGVTVDDMTAGQLVVLADIYDLADYKDCVTPLHLL